MKVTKEQSGACEVTLNITVEAEKVDKAILDAYKKIGKNVTLPGFRKGKAPLAILKANLNEEAVMDEAADALMQPAYKEALEETGVEPFAIANVDIKTFEKGKDMEFTAKVPQPPVITLGDYTGIEIDKEPTDVSDEAVEEEVTNFLRRNAKYPEVDREVADDDLVVYELREKDNPDAAVIKNYTRIGHNELTDLDDGLRGMKAGEEKEITINYPEKYYDKDLAGTSKVYNATAAEIRVEDLPELTDEWIKENFPVREGMKEEDIIDTVDKFRATVRKSMEDYAKQQSDTGAENALVEKIVENANVEFHSCMVEEQVKASFENLARDLKKNNVTIDQYLKHNNMTFAELEEAYKEDAEKLLKVSLVLREIAAKENLAPTDDDVKEEAEKIAAARKVPVETAVAYVEKSGMLDDVRNRILHRKLMEFLMGSAKINQL